MCPGAVLQCFGIVQAGPSGTQGTAKRRPTCLRQVLRAAMWQPARLISSGWPPWCLGAVGLGPTAQQCKACLALMLRTGDTQPLCWLHDAHRQLLLRCCCLSSHCQMGFSKPVTHSKPAITRNKPSQPRFMQLGIANYSGLLISGGIFCAAQSKCHVSLPLVQQPSLGHAMCAMTKHQARHIKQHTQPAMQSSPGTPR